MSEEIKAILKEIQDEAGRLKYDPAKHPVNDFPLLLELRKISAGQALLLKEARRTNEMLERLGGLVDYLSEIGYFKT